MGAMNPEVQAAQAAFGSAASKFMEIWLTDLGRQDMSSGLAVMRTLQQGGFVTISVSAAPLTREQSCTLSVTDLAGRMSPLSSVDFEWPAQQA